MDENSSTGNVEECSKGKVTVLVPKLVGDTEA